VNPRASAQKLPPDPRVAARRKVESAGNGSRDAGTWKQGMTYGDVMLKDLGHVSELVRYPVKSMAGCATESAFLGWHGLDGDRRFAFRRLGDQSGFPWLSASRLPELLLYHPCGLDESTGEPLPTHVRTPAGDEVALRSPELQAEIAGRLGSGVELMNFKHGIFDDGDVSVISMATMAGISGEAGVTLDHRRFRGNIVLETDEAGTFLEDGWLGGTLLFGDSEPRPAVSVTMRDVRCAMINLDPDTAKQDPRMLKTAVRLNGNNAGVYGTVVRTGTIRLGDRVRLALDAQR
jgi:uncharacterized protein YcbX